MAWSRFLRGKGSVSRWTKQPSHVFASIELRICHMACQRRRTAIALFALFAIALPPTAQEQPFRGGTLIFGINSGDPPTYDCHQSVLFPIIHLLTPHYSNLLKIDTPNYPKIIGDLAESWIVADDAKTYTFKLHANVKFHDGSPFSSEDIKASYDRIRN